MINQDDEDKSENNLSVSAEGREEKADADDPDGVVKVPPEILEKLPPSIQREVKQTIGVFSHSGLPGYSSKITSEHITELISKDKYESGQNFKLQREGRIYNLVYVLIAIIALIGFTVFFFDKDPQFTKDILLNIVVAIAGFFAGWGAKSGFSK